MEATRFASVFDINTEYHPVRAFGWAEIVHGRYRSNTREDQGVGWRRTRQWPAYPVIIRVAESELQILETREVAIRQVLRCRSAARQACAQQRVEDAFRGIRMEVRGIDVAWIAFALVMAIMLPLAADARIGQYLRTILLGVWRA